MTATSCKNLPSLVTIDRCLADLEVTDREMLLWCWVNYHNGSERLTCPLVIKIDGGHERTEHSLAYSKPNPLTHLPIQSSGTIDLIEFR